MKTRTVYIPPFLHTQVNKKEDGSLLTKKEAIKEQLSEALNEHFDAQGEDADFILICGKEKLDSGDCQYGIAVITINLADDNSNFIKVKMPNFTTLPTVFIDNENGVSEVIDRVLNNYAFV